MALHSLHHSSRGPLTTESSNSKGMPHFLQAIACSSKSVSSSSRKASLRTRDPQGPDGQAPSFSDSVATFPSEACCCWSEACCSWSKVISFAGLSLTSIIIHFVVSVHLTRDLRLRVSSSIPLSVPSLETLPSPTDCQAGMAHAVCPGSQ